MSWIDRYPPDMHGLIQKLLGCAWGRAIATYDDMEECDEQASNIVVLHNGGSAWDVKLCEHHVAKVKHSTVPHVDIGIRPSQ